MSAGAGKGETQETQPEKIDLAAANNVSTNSAQCDEAAIYNTSIYQCPRGLECLLPLDEVIIVTTATSDLGWVEDKAKQRLYNLKKTYGPGSSEHVIHFYDKNDKEIVRRVIDAYSCCLYPVLCCCADQGTGLVESIEAPPGQQIARTQQISAWFAFRLRIYDESNNGRLVLNSSCSENGLNVATTTGDQIGKLIFNRPKNRNKNWTTTVTFPVDLDVRLKAALLWISS
ncbi:unnamed protein product [Clavelina lepadiformis]|uniref:Phospholipid scramblase n=1 Tax=Clavelina lepadiformis TaxID=159417 RepID=A0ABP0G782_CLALP